MALDVVPALAEGAEQVEQAGALFGRRRGGAVVGGGVQLRGGADEGLGQRGFAGLAVDVVERLLDRVGVLGVFGAGEGVEEVEEE